MPIHTTTNNSRTRANYISDVYAYNVYMFRCFNALSLSNQRKIESDKQSQTNYSQIDRTKQSTIDRLRWQTEFATKKIATENRVSNINKPSQSAQTGCNKRPRARHIQFQN